MKICVAQPRPVPGDIAANISDHQHHIERAAARGAGLVVFPELSLTGYEPDLAEALATRPDDTRLDIFQRLADTHSLTIGAGIPLRKETGITIGMALFAPRQPRQVYEKKYIHADEEPFFLHGQDSPGLIGGDARIALAICYELSVPEHAEEAARRGAKIYIASAVKTVAQVVKARERLAEIARHYRMTVLLANCVGSSGEQVWGGKSAVWDANGALIGELDGTEAGILLFDTGTQATQVNL